MELKLNIIILTALLFLSVISSGSRAPEDQFQFSVENSDVCPDDKDSNIEEDEFLVFDSSNKVTFLIPQAALFTSNTVRTSILNSEIWNPPKK
ncbi:MAG: hypothetical protein ACM3S2_04280 [Ignavibacteriales bacterium]